MAIPQGYSIKKWKAGSTPQYAAFVGDVPLHRNPVQTLAKAKSLINDDYGLKQFQAKKATMKTDWLKELNDKAKKRKQYK